MLREKTPDAHSKDHITNIGLKQMMKNSNSVQEHGEKIDLNNHISFVKPQSDQLYINEKAFVLGKTRADVKKG